MTSYYCQSLQHLYSAVAQYMVLEVQDVLKSVVAEMAVASTNSHPLVPL